MFPVGSRAEMEREEHRMRSRIARHPVVAFFIVTCAFSWILWGLMIASQRGSLPFRFPTNWTGSFGPFFGAIVVAAALKGGAGVRDLLRPVLRWRFGPRWYFFVVIGIVLPFLAAIGIYALLGRSVSIGRTELAAGLKTLPLYYVVILLIGGPLGEEIGWRGFALPRLLERRGMLGASLVVFAMWFAWHVPLFWLEGAAQKGSSIPVFALLVLASSVIFTWTYVGTGGSLLAVLLLHASINTFGFAFGQAAPALDADPVLGLVTAAVFAAFAAGVLLLERRRASARSARTGASDTRPVF
jgi:membrane protease YdiL (CAAX protease family)